MYTINGIEQIVELNELPPLSPGAPMPVVVADEFVVQVAYIVHEDLTAWTNLEPTVLNSDIQGELYAIAKFDHSCSHYFGLPNDEAFNGHPLFSRGLQRYSISEVFKSPWIASLERMNSVHPNHRTERFHTYRHFILAFHDSIFECVARKVSVTFFRGTLINLISEMATSLT